MAPWELLSEDLKRYPHFDSELSIEEAISLATSPKRVIAHKFYPFLLYKNRWTRFAPKGQRGAVKERPIRYASRGDAYIFGHYRHLLSEAYETALLDSSLNDSVIAYRRIRGEDGKGKCNIHFARDAFEKIVALGNCCAIALDISDFFESLDHDLLKQAWCDVLKVDRLPDDHFKVFRAVTKYAVVNKEDVYERLGYFGQKQNANGEVTAGYLIPYRQMPKQLCTGAEFRQKIAGENGSQSLIKVNLKNRGIPQGSPISDVLANIYLLKFDLSVRKRIDALGGVYFRYSDDIFVVFPGNEDEGKALADEIRGLIKSFGSKLIIKEKKSSVFVFAKNGTTQKCKLVQGMQGKNGLEYLGFRFDGTKVFIRDSTLSGLYRKVTRSARYEAVSLVERHPGKDYKFLEGRFDFEKLIQRFGRVQDFGEIGDDYRNWTFWTYARRAANLFGPMGSSITRQLRMFRKNVRIRAQAELARALGE